MFKVSTDNTIDKFLNRFEISLGIFMVSKAAVQHSGWGRIENGIHEALDESQSDKEYLIHIYKHIYIFFYIYFFIYSDQKISFDRA